MVCADMSAARSILVFKHDEDKIVHLDDTVVAALAGENGDRNQLGDYLKCNIKLTKLKTGVSMGVDAIASYVRTQVSVAIAYRNNATHYFRPTGSIRFLPSYSQSVIQTSSFS